MVVGRFVKKKVVWKNYWSLIENENADIWVVINNSLLLSRKFKGFYAIINIVGLGGPLVWVKAISDG